MSIRNETDRPRVSRQSRRLDEVLRAGANQCGAGSNRASASTGVGPLLNMPRRLLDWASPNTPAAWPPSSLPVPGNEENNQAFRKMLPDPVKVSDWPLSGVAANNVLYDGIYTGDLYNGKPEGEGQLVVSDLVANDSELDRALKRASSLRDAYLKVKTHFHYEVKELATWTISGSWYRGQLVAGDVTTSKTLQDGSTIQVGTLITDSRPFGDVKSQAGFAEERRMGARLISKIFVEDATRVVGWLGGVTMYLSGRIRWSTRPTEHNFPWAKDVEEVRMRNGKGTLSIDPDLVQQAANPVLSGRAEVTLVTIATGRPITLYGEMTDNRLLGVVHASQRLPEGVGASATSFFIEGYGTGGDPMVRLLTPLEKKAHPRPSLPAYDVDLDEGPVRGWASDSDTEDRWFSTASAWALTLGGLLTVAALLPKNKERQMR